MDERVSRLPLLRIMMGNATLLSVVYLAFGLVLEVLRRLSVGRAPRLALVVERAWEGMDQLPARVLELVGLLTPLREAYLSGKVSELGLRLCFASTALSIIFAMAIAVGAMMWVVRLVFYRHALGR